MKILLAGAAGAIGRLLLPLLVQAGHEVTGTTRSPDRQPMIADLGGRPAVLDALDRQTVFAVMQAAQPDILIHQLTDLATRDFAANSRLRVDGSRNLVDAAQSVGVHRMIAQSISWVCVPGAGLSTEDDPLDLNAAAPRAGTVAAVQALEQATTELLVGVVLRYGLLYGPGTWYTREGLTSDQIRRGEIKASDAVSSFVHVADAAQAAFEALQWPSGIYNIVDDAPAKASEWVPFYARLIGAPEPEPSSGAQAWERGASNAKARAVGWTPRYPDWREGFTSELTS